MIGFRLIDKVFWNRYRYRSEILLAFVALFLFAVTAPGAFSAFSNPIALAGSVDSPVPPRAVQAYGHPATPQLRQEATQHRGNPVRCSELLETISRFQVLDFITTVQAYGHDRVATSLRGFGGSTTSQLGLSAKRVNRSKRKSHGIPPSRA
jgi:hypothetical protein